MKIAAASLQYWKVHFVIVVLKLADLQTEIGRIQEFINSLYDDLKKPLLTSLEQRALKAEIVSLG